jgi:hypothetical protein
VDGGQENIQAARHAIRLKDYFRDAISLIKTIWGYEP